MGNTFYFPEISGCREWAGPILSGQTPVYLYGLGSAAENRIRMFQDLGVKILQGFDKNSALWGTRLLGVEIRPPQEMANKEIPVVICTDKYFFEVYNELTQLGFQKLLPFFFHFGGKAYSYREYTALLPFVSIAVQHNAAKNLADKNTLFLQSLDVAITDKCSLRCRDCSNLMQYFESPQDAEREQLLETVDRIMQAADFVAELRVLGGEPFVSKELPAYIERLCQYQNIWSVVVYTNGTILPKGESLSCLRRKNVLVRISNYGPVSRHVPELVRLFEENEILYSVSNDLKWQDCSGFDFQNRTEPALEALYQTCCVKGTLALKNGMLYACPFAANAAALGAVPAEADEAVAILDGKDTAALREALQAFVKKPFFKICNYCAGRPLDGLLFPAAIQTPKPLPYHAYR